MTQVVAAFGQKDNGGQNNRRNDQPCWMRGSQQDRRSLIGSRVWYPYKWLQNISPHGSFEN